MYATTAEPWFFLIEVLKLAISDHTAGHFHHLSSIRITKQNVSVLKWNSSEPPVCYTSFTISLSVVKVIWLFQTAD